MTSRQWLPLILGVLLGLSGGLYYAWVANPVEYVETAPVSLREDFRADYMALIASAYAATGDLERAQARLKLLPAPNQAEVLAALAQQRLAMGQPEVEARALAVLAAALGERPTPLSTGLRSTRPARTPTRTRQPTETPTATATAIPPPTRTPTGTPGAPFELVDQERVCDPDLSAPLIQVEVVDAAGAGVPAREVLVVWDAGQDRFFTGLKPELGRGYADFTMSEGVAYTVQLRDSNDFVTGLIAEDCVSEAGDLFLGSWRLRFAQPGPGGT